jgi:hypothetical protein
MSSDIWFLRCQPCWASAGAAFTRTTAKRNAWNLVIDGIVLTSVGGVSTGYPAGVTGP